MDRQGHLLSCCGQLKKGQNKGQPPPLSGNARKKKKNYRRSSLTQSKYFNASDNRDLSSNLFLSKLPSFPSSWLPSSANYRNVTPMSLTCPAPRPPICPHRVPTFQMAPATNHIISHQSPRFPYQRLDLFHQPRHIQSRLMKDTYMWCTLEWVGKWSLDQVTHIMTFEIHLE